MSDYELLAMREMGFRGMYICLKSKSPKVITPGLVNEIRRLQNMLAEQFISGSITNNYYVVWYMEKNCNVECNGLDFNFILTCLKNNKESDLEYYIDSLYDLIFLNHIGLGFPIINCSFSSRSLNGLYKEFFFLNQICFLYHPKLKGINKISITNEYSNLLFDKEIYEKNHFYHFNKIKIDKMRKILEVFEPNIIPTEQIFILKEKFENIKKESMNRIYKIASKNLKIFERMAKYDII